MVIAKSAPRVGKHMALLAVAVVGLVGLAQRPSYGLSSSSYEPMFIYCERTIKPGQTDKYKVAVALNLTRPSVWT